MNLTQMSVVDLLAALRSPDPTPGGGSASALAGAIGAALLAMVASMPSRRAASEADVDKLQEAGGRSAQLSERLTALVDQDTEAYGLVVAAFRLPRTSEAEKTMRSARIQEAMKSAIEAPLDVMRQCSGAADAAIVVAALGNPNAASDVGVALELLAAGLRGAKLNVEINLGSIKDAAYAEDTRQQVSTLLTACDSSVAAARAHLASAA
jgi:formiminotetrahydrofolate cyclodeaminase